MSSLAGHPGDMIGRQLIWVSHFFAQPNARGSGYAEQLTSHEGHDVGFEVCHATPHHITEAQDVPRTENTPRTPEGSPQGRGQNFGRRASRGDLQFLPQGPRRHPKAMRPAEDSVWQSLHPDQEPGRSPGRWAGPDTPPRAEIQTGRVSPF